MPRISRTEVIAIIAAVVFVVAACVGIVAWVIPSDASPPQQPAQGTGCITPNECR